MSLKLISSTSFAEKLIQASQGQKGIVEPTFVYLPGVSGGEPIAKEVGVEYFSVPVELGVCNVLALSRPRANKPAALGSTTGNRHLV